MFYKALLLLASFQHIISIQSSGLEKKDLFGGKELWSEKSFVAVDDRVRQGKSQSYLTVFENNTASFNGFLDTKTLGGAGFATQSVESEDPIYDFTGYSGLELLFGNYDGKKYSIDLSNAYSHFTPNGSKASKVDFQSSFGIEDIYEKVGDVHKIYFPFDKFVPIERGREVKNPRPILNLLEIRKVAFQIRSFFNEQSGSFSINLISLSLVHTPSFIDQQTQE